MKVTFVHLVAWTRLQPDWDTINSIMLVGRSCPVGGCQVDDMRLEGGFLSIMRGKLHIMIPLSNVASMEIEWAGQLTP